MTNNLYLKRITVTVCIHLFQIYSSEAIYIFVCFEVTGQPPVNAENRIPHAKTVPHNSKIVHL